MLREEAIEVLEELWKYEHSPFSEKDTREALEMAIRALEQTETTTTFTSGYIEIENLTNEDLISCEEVLEELNRIKNEKVSRNGESTKIDRAINYVAELPTYSANLVKESGVLVKDLVKDGDLISRFRDYQIEWLTSHNDIDLQETEMWVVQFLKDTAECFLKTELPSVKTDTDLISRETLLKELSVVQNRPVRQTDVDLIRRTDLLNKIWQKEYGKDYDGVNMLDIPHIDIIENMPSYNSIKTELNEDLVKENTDLVKEDTENADKKGISEEAVSQSLVKDTDLISRDYILSIFKEHCDRCGKYKGYNGVMCRCCELDDAIDYVECAPSAEKTAEWLESDIPNEKYKCSNCGGACWSYDYERIIVKSRFCPNCGAKMKGESE